MEGDVLRAVKDRVLLWDGAMGTELMKRGLGPGDVPCRMNITDPAAVQAVYRAYFDAGSDGVETNTFSATRIMLSRYGLGGETARISRRAAELAREVAPPGRFVSGSIGPSGMFPDSSPNAQAYGPELVLPESEMYDAFAEQATALKDGGAHVLIVETMDDLGELRVAVRAAIRETGLPVFGLMTFDPDSPEVRTTMGFSVEDMVRCLEEEGVGVLGSNCSNPIQRMVEIVGEIRRHTRLPIIANPNAGLPGLVGGKTVYRETPDGMASHVPELVRAGANIVGGCCGTTPDHIAVFRRVLGRARSHP